MSIPSEKTKAPTFNRPGSDGNTHKLSDFKDQTIVLYFYPKDDTSGCTTQACGLRDDYAKIKKLAVILGVSPDPMKKHDKFIEKYDLPFVLLSDEDKSMCEKYGVWVEKSMYVRKYMGVARTTFIIDGKGKIVKVFEKVKPAKHVQDVLEFLTTS